MSGSSLMSILFLQVRECYVTQLNNTSFDFAEAGCVDISREMALLNSQQSSHHSTEKYHWISTILKAGVTARRLPGLIVAVIVLRIQVTCRLNLCTHWSLQPGQQLQPDSCQRVTVTPATGSFKLGGCYAKILPDGFFFHGCAISQSVVFGTQTLHN